jgi:hypothetical protein
MIQLFSQHYHSASFGINLGNRFAESASATNALSAFCMPTCVSFEKPRLLSGAERRQGRIRGCEKRKWQAAGYGGKCELRAFSPLDVYDEIRMKSFVVVAPFGVNALPIITPSSFSVHLRSNRWVFW